MSFAEQYGPWAIVAGASDGVGRAFAETLASRGLNVVLLARRRETLNDVSSSIERQYKVQTRVIAMDLATTDAAARLMAEVNDLEIGFFVYCAGADSNFKPFLSSPLEVAESMLHRNCNVLMQLSHHLCGPMATRGRGATVILGSGAGFSGTQNMVAYAATKAFDMVFAEALWCELKPKGVNVLGLILGETDTPSLRKLRYERGLSKSTDEPVKGAETPQYVVDDALAHLEKGPIRLANKMMRVGLRFLYPFSRNFVVGLMAKASEKIMGKDIAQ
ncbi:SDR family NAD(P)-dependent oxidoreductase [Stenotrophobium rhamnosiphilum]|uniref:Short-chain dehydrogenase n=1 Tax=Stenotrophobium rhamnosiphilum TaxID=2029166 RepID=A0A2T5MIU0_9GAMM|nr:short-chain dehydrogenase [Stenotrophobium rhamnosiphilum]